MKEVVAYIESFCEAHDECVFVNIYSGRFMFGRSCIGFTVYGNYLDILVELCDFLRDIGVICLSDVFGTVCIDEMGTGHIIYFPDLMSEVDGNGDL